MPSMQSTYSTMTAARVGQLAEWNDSQVTISRVLETTTGVGFGVAVQQGAADYGVKAIGDGSATSFLGITVRNQSMDANYGDLWPAGSNVRLITKGVVWVTVAANVTAGSAVYYTPTGGFTNVSNSGANTLVPNARFDTSASSGALAVVRLG